MKSTSIAIFIILLISGFLVPQTTFAMIPENNEEQKSVIENTFTTTKSEDNSEANNEDNSGTRLEEIDPEKIVLIYPGKLCGEGTEFKEGLCVVKPTETPHFDQNKIEAGYTLLLFLLFIYYIPAQSIERALEVLDPYRRIWPRRSLNRVKDHDETLKAIRNKKFIENTSYKITDSDLVIPENKSKPKKSKMISNSSSVSLSNLNLSFAQNSDKLHNETNIRTGVFFISACLSAIIPSIIIAEAGLGPMYIIENLLENKVPDPDDWGNKLNNIVINILFIASGTQPIHKIIELIPKVRKPTS